MILEKLEKEDKIRSELLSKILYDAEEEEAKTFSIDGSLLDHKITEYAEICNLSLEDGMVRYSFDPRWPEALKGKRRKERDRLRDTLLRAGVCKHTNLDMIVKRLREYDDAILALDTNIILDCVITSSLLEEIYMESFPNWIMFALPQMAEAEIENMANTKMGGKDHPRVGWPSFKGRRGQRGLQELLELDEPRSDRPGISIITVGELDNYKSLKSYFQGGEETWWRDSRIRSQIREFLGGFDFHKGVFFLSEDRVNTMMSSIEGVTGLYLQKPEWNDVKEGRTTHEKFSKLLYELSLQFGEIRMKSEEEEFVLEMNLSIFWPGKHVEDWEKSKVKLTTLKK